MDSDKKACTKCGKMIRRWAFQKLGGICGECYEKRFSKLRSYGKESQV